MMMTFLPFAWSGGNPSSSVTGSPSCTRLDHGRNSIAWWMPSSSRPGIGRSRDAVAPPAADAVVPFEDRHRMACARELLGRSQAGGAGSDDGDLLAGALLRRQ